MLVKVILRHRDIVEIDLDDSQLVYDGVDFVDPQDATHLAIRLSVDGCLPSPPIGEERYEQFFNGFGIEVCPVTTETPTTYWHNYEAIQIPGIMREPCIETQISDVIDSSVLVPNLLNKEPSWIPEMPNNSTNNPISSGDWVGVSVVGQFTAGAFILRGQPVSLFGSQVRPSTDPNLAVIGFASRDTEPGEKVIILNGLNRLLNWTELTGYSSVIPGANYYIDDSGLLTTSPASKRMFGVATSDDEILFSPSALSTHGTDSNSMQITYTGSETIETGTVVAFVSGVLSGAQGIASRKDVVGVVTTGGGPNSTLTIAVSGVVPLAPNSVIGSHQEGDTLYLSLTQPGKLEVFIDVNNAPVDSYLVRVGTVISSDSFRLDIQEAVGL